MGLTRRQLLVGAAAFGAAKLIPSVALGEERELNPENDVFVVGDLHLTRHWKYAYEKASRMVSALRELSGIHPEKLDSGFLDSELGRDREKRVVVATHFPPDKLTWIKDKFGKQPGYNLWVKEEIIRRIAKARASVLCSHSHAPFAGIYESRGLETDISVVGTPPVTYTLPYLGTEFRPPRVLGITVLDTGRFVRGTRFFNGKKAFRPARLRVESRKGTFKPLPIIMKH